MTQGSVPTISIPSGIPGQSLDLDLTYIRYAEGRLQDVATVNPSKAPELLYVYNRAYLDLTKFLGSVEAALDEAKRYSARIRGIVILDRCPEILKARGLATARNPGGSEDLRQSVLDQDPEYIASLEQVSCVQAWITILRGKAKAMEGAFSSVKRLVGDTASAYRRPNPNLVASSQEFASLPPLSEPQILALEPGPDDREPAAGAPLTDLFGTARYRD